VIKYRDGDNVSIKLDKFNAERLNDKNVAFFTASEIASFTPAPFDWADVKPGMAFTFIGTREGEEQRVYYCFTNKDGDMLFSMGDHAHPQALRSFGDNTLTRAHEYDIEVK